MYIFFVDLGEQCLTDQLSKKSLGLGLGLENYGGIGLGLDNKVLFASLLTIAMKLPENYNYMWSTMTTPTAEATETAAGSNGALFFNLYI